MNNLRDKIKLAEAKVRAEALVDKLYPPEEQSLLRKRYYTFDDVVELVAYIIIAFKRGNK